MKRVNKPNESGIIESDFDGHVKAGFKVEYGNIIVLGGYGWTRSTNQNRRLI